MNIHRFDEIKHFSGSAFNVCLYYGSDNDRGTHIRNNGNAVGKARMGCVNWEDAYPEVDAKLIATEIDSINDKPDLQRKSAKFSLCPELKCSIISKSIADSFNLQTVSCVGRVNIPLQPILSPNTPPVLCNELASAPISFSGISNVYPHPTGECKYEFFVLNSLDYRSDIALIGRNIINDMLLLYRGQTIPLLPGNSIGPGKLYWGHGDIGYK